MPEIFFLFQALFFSLTAVLIVGQISIWFARRIKLIDFPGSAPHKQHTRPTPLAGGIALVGTLLLCEWIFSTFTDVYVRGTFIAGLPIFIFGLWDDYKNIPPLIKLLGQIIAAVILIYLGITIRVLESPGFFIRGTGGIYTYLDWLITIFWVVGITNAFNFVDSMDGLAVGLGGMAAAFFMLVTLGAQQPILSLHSAFIIGVCTGLYFYNSSPARLFLGDSGAQSLGFILAVLGIGYSPQGVYGASSWFIPIMLLVVPIFDTVLIVFSRIRRKLPISSARLDHTYHRLLNLGLESNRAVLIMQIAAFSLSCLAFVLLDQTPLTANLVFVAVLLLGGFILVFLDNPRHWV